MNYKYPLLVTLLVFLCNITAYAQDGSDGITALQSGDFKKAEEIFRPLAEKGDSTGQVGLGFVHYFGGDEWKDYDKAAQWTKLSAAQANPHAQHHLGYLYEQGHGVKKDNAQAFFWYTLAGYTAIFDRGIVQSADKRRANLILTDEEQARAAQYLERCLKNKQGFQNCVFDD